MYKLLLLNRNTWNDLNDCKQIIIIEFKEKLCHMIVYKLLSMGWNTWNNLNANKRWLLNINIFQTI